MKIIKYIIAMVLVYSLTGAVSAKEYLPELFALPEDEKQALVNTLEFEVLDADENSTPITSICLNEENGCIAISCDGAMRDQIKILSPEGNYITGFEFFIDGIFYVDWNEESIVLYYTRDNIAIVISLDGEIVALKGYHYGGEINDYFVELSKTACVGAQGTTYRLSYTSIISKLFADYDCIVVENASREEILIYECNNEMLRSVVDEKLIVVCATGLCLVIMFWGINVKIIQTNKR